jgi:integrase
MLTTREVETLKKPGRHHDRDGLYMQVQPSGAKSWLLIFARHGRQRQMGLGSVRTGSKLKGLALAEAREAAKEAHRLLSTGVDPIDAKRARRPPKAVKTFRELTEEYIEWRQARWRNEKTAAQFRRSLANYAYPTIGNLAADAITVEDIKAILKSSWSTKPVMAAHVRVNIAAVLNFAKAHGYRAADNPAAWRGNLEYIMPEADDVRQPEHHAMLPYADLPTLMTELRARNGVAPLALQWTILTATRTNEAINARWSDIDMETKTWIIPGARMKSGRPHKVPLSDAALAILDKLPREKGNPYLFPGGRRGKGISNMAMLKAIKQLRSDVTVHGTARAGFRTWCSERGENREVAEAALAHVLGDKTERAYGRSDLFDARRGLMDRWAKFLG